MSELETRLAELRVEWPRRARRRRARARAAGGRAASAPPSGRAWAVALAIILVSAGGVAAVPSARSAVLRWLGIEGVRIERVPADAHARAVRGIAARPRRADAAREGTLVPRARSVARTRSSPRASG